jgi:hypothetical protein
MGWWKSFTAGLRDREASVRAAREERERRERDAAPPPASGPGSYRLKGQPIVCACSSTVFARSRMGMHSNAAAFFDVEWMSDSATVLTCTTCGRIHLFAWAPERIP